MGAASVATLLTLAACGASGNDSAPQVAALPSNSRVPGSGQSAPVPSTTASAGRPQERIDDTPQQDLALAYAFWDCLIAHGASSRPVPHGNGQLEPTSGTRQESAACANKLPLPPPELDPSKNPNYRNDMLAEISCMRSHGVLVHLTTDTSVFPDGLSWTFDDNSPPVGANEEQIEDSCQQTAFADKK
jgi:hypothetical protein